MATVYIYALCDPDSKEPKYVGQTVNPRKRYNAHFAEAKCSAFYGCKKKAEWINGLLELSKKPELIILEEVDHRQGDITEQAWIDKFRNEGKELINYPSPRPSKLCTRAENGGVSSIYKY